VQRLDSKNYFGRPMPPRQVTRPACVTIPLRDFFAKRASDWPALPLLYQFCES
jgi:hypothetical protein